MTERAIQSIARDVARHGTTVAVLAALWWLVSSGAPGSWLVGVPFVMAAAWAFQRLGGGTATAPSVAGLARFAPFFLWESLRGGVDVVGRTLAPRPAIRPGFVRYPLALRGLTARVFFINCVSLVPGTLAAEIHGDELVVHALNTAVDPRPGLERLESAVARIFHEPGPGR